MAIKLEFVSVLSDPDGFERLMREYYHLVGDKLAAAGGPRLSAVDLAADTMEHLYDLMPLNGRVMLATRDDGTLVVSGVIRKIRPDAAELKRMYVRPEAQGLGIGRQLLERRSALTSSLFAARAVSPARRFFLASMKSFDHS